MSKGQYEYLREAIVNNMELVSVGIYAHGGVEVYDESGRKVSRTTAMVLGSKPPKAELLKRRLAKAREIALTRLKMVSATVLLVDREYYDANFGEFKNIAGADGRILGMNIKLTARGGMLPGESAFVIKDPPEAAGGEVAAGAGSSVASSEAAGATGATGCDSKAESAGSAGSGWGAGGMSVLELGNSLLQALIKEGWTPPSGSNWEMDYVYEGPVTHGYIYNGYGYSLDDTMRTVYALRDALGATGMTGEDIVAVMDAFLDAH